MAEFQAYRCQVSEQILCEQCDYIMTCWRTAQVWPVTWNCYVVKCVLPTMDRRGSNTPLSSCIDVQVTGIMWHEGSYDFSAWIQNFIYANCRRSLNIASVYCFPQHICSQKREKCVFFDCILIMAIFDAFTWQRTKLATTKQWFFTSLEIKIVTRQSEHLESDIPNFNLSVLCHITFCQWCGLDFVVTW